MTSDCHLNLSGASVYDDLEDLPLTLFGPGFFYCLGPGGVVFRDPPKYLRLAQ